MSRGARALAAVAAALVIAFTLAFGAASALGLEEDAAWTAALGSARSPAASAALVVSALAADLLLPVPSSVVMTWSGLALGPLGGAAASSAGALLGSALGYGACRAFGRSAFARVVGESELPGLQAAFDRRGAWLVLLARPVPMLPETVACLAGLAGMSAPRFLGLSAAGTVPWCALYAALGARAQDPTESALAAGVALGLPALGLLAARALGVDRAGPGP